MSESAVSYRTSYIIGYSVPRKVDGSKIMN